MQKDNIRKSIIILSTFLCFVTPLDAITKQEAMEKYLEYKKLAEKYKKLAEQPDDTADKQQDTATPTTKENVEAKVEQSPAKSEEQATLKDNKKEEKKDNSPWKGTSIGLGGSIVTGNSATTNLNVGININYNPSEQWQNNLLFNYLYTHDDTVSDKSGIRVNRAQLSAKSSWDYDKRNGVYGNLNVLRDELDVFNYVFMESAGYKRILYKNDNMSLNVTAGPSLTQSQLNSTGQFTNGFGAQSGVQYIWNFTKDSSFKEDFIVNYAYQNNNTGNPNVFIYQSNTILSAKLYKNLSLQLQFQLNSTNVGLPGKLPITTITTTALAYEI
jgi:putative salt-induced outer membrane protein YdiY